MVLASHRCQNIDGPVKMATHDDCRETPSLIKWLPWMSRWSFDSALNSAHPGPLGIRGKSFVHGTLGFNVLALAKRDTGIHALRRAYLYVVCNRGFRFWCLVEIDIFVLMFHMSCYGRTCPFFGPLWWWVVNSWFMIGQLVRQWNFKFLRARCSCSC